MKVRRVIVCHDGQFQSGFHWAGGFVHTGWARTLDEASAKIDEGIRKTQADFTVACDRDVEIPDPDPGMAIRGAYKFGRKVQGEQIGQSGDKPHGKK